MPGFTRDEESASHPDVAGAAPALEPRPILAYGATGDDVVRLKNLLRVLGYDVAENDQLGEDCLEVVRKAQLELGVEESRAIAAGEVPFGVSVIGELVGPATWGALYEAAGARIEERRQQEASQA